MAGFPLLAIGASLSQDTSVFNPASPPAESIRSLFVLVLAVTGVIFLIVEGVLIYSIFKFRTRGTPPGPPLPRGGKDLGAVQRGGMGSGTNAEPPQVYGSLPIEIAWTAAPALIVFLLSLILARTEFEVRKNPDHPEPGSKPLYVKVIGRQWWWEYYYQTYDGRKLEFHAANELHVPAGDANTPRPVYLTLESADVCHSFWVPRLAGKTDLIPGKTNQLWFQTDKPGLYIGQCAEYCGTQHAHMLLRVNVDSPQEFDAWLENQMKPAIEDASEQAGRESFLRLSCVDCHRVTGTRARGTYAPDLTHLASRQTLASGMVPNNRAELRKWVFDPQQTKPGCLMPSFGLTQKEVDKIVSYLMTLK